jgi:hypothetical protein
MFRQPELGATKEGADWQFSFAHWRLHVVVTLPIFFEGLVS